MPPAMPTSASRASPGPFTTHPITATLIGRSQVFSRSSTRSANPTRSISVRPHVGQEIITGPFSRRPSAFRISNPTYTSSHGSPVSDTRIVSPIPPARITPIPTDDRIVPTRGVPASVIPTCRG